MNETDPAPVGPRTDLRPMGIGDIFDATFELYRRNFVLLLGVVAIVRVPVACLGFAVGTRWLAISEKLEAYGPRPPPGTETKILGLVATQLLLACLLLLVEAVVVAPLLYGGLTWAAARRWLGLPARLVQSLGRALRRWPALAGAALVTVAFTAVTAGTLVFIGAFVAIATTAVFGSTPVGIVAVVLVIVVLTGPGAILVGLVSSRLALFFPAAIVEGRTAFGALGRAWRLTRGAAWRTLGVVMVGITIKLFLVAGPAAALTLLAQSTALLTPDQALVFSSFADVLASLLFDPVLFTAIAIHFFDLKVRREAYDLQLAAQARWAEAPAEAS